MEQQVDFSLTAIQQIIVPAARQELLPRFARVERRQKLDGSFLTEADLAMQEQVAGQLLQHWPDTVCLGEEMGATEQASLLAAEQPVWCLSSDRPRPATKGIADVHDPTHVAPVLRQGRFRRRIQYRSARTNDFPGLERVFSTRHRRQFDKFPGLA